MSKPLAYAAVAADGSESVYVASLKEQAEACCRENGWFLLPLYAAPPTWQDEVAAVEAAFERSGVQPTWPDDEAGNVGPMAEAMSDEIDRLRNGAAEGREMTDTETNGQTPVAWMAESLGGPSGLFFEPDVESLKTYGFSVVPLYRSPRLTDEEREAIEDAAGICEEHAEEYDGTVSSPIADTLRNLLARLA